MSGFSSCYNPWSWLVGIKSKPDPVTFHFFFISFLCYFSASIHSLCETEVCHLFIRCQTNLVLWFPQCRLQSTGCSQEVVRFKCSHSSPKAPLVFYTKMMLQRAFFFLVGKIIDPRQVAILYSYHSQFKCANFTQVWPWHNGKSASAIKSHPREHCFLFCHNILCDKNKMLSKISYRELLWWLICGPNWI